MALRDMRKYNLQSFVFGNSQNGKTHTEDTYDYNQALLDEQFELLGNVFTIQEEVNRGSLVFSDVRASVNIVENIKSKTVADDVRILGFKDINHQLFVGKRFKFDNNVWLVTNLKTIMSPYSNCLVKRCNNTLKWLDLDNGIIYEEPCVIENKISNVNDEQKQNFQTVSGIINVILQYNENSKNIKINDRFVINGYSYEVLMVFNGFRQNTYDKDSVGNIVLEMQLVNRNNAYDDAENNIVVPDDDCDVILEGDVVTPNIDNLSSYEPYNIGTYEIYHYVNGEKTDDEFEINFYDALPNTYKVLSVDSNSFTIECLDYSKIPLVVSYKNLRTQEIGEFKILLRGVL